MTTRIETWSDYRNRADAWAAAKSADRLNFAWTLSSLSLSAPMEYRLVVWVSGERVPNG